MFSKGKQNDTESSSLVSVTAIPAEVIRPPAGGVGWQCSVTGRTVGTRKPKDNYPLHILVCKQFIHSTEEERIMKRERDSYYKQLLRLGSTSQKVEKG